MGKQAADSMRVTTTLTRQQHVELERLAKRNDVTVAWLVRRAVDRLIEQASGGPMLPFDSEGGPQPSKKVIGLP